MPKRALLINSFFVKGKKRKRVLGSGISHLERRRFLELEKEIQGAFIAALREQQLNEGGKKRTKDLCIFPPPFPFPLSVILEGRPSFNIAPNRKRRRRNQLIIRFPLLRSASPKDFFAKTFFGLFSPHCPETDVVLVCS